MQFNIYFRVTGGGDINFDCPIAQFMFMIILGAHKFSTAKVHMKQ